jgi:hypothetical protein
MENKSTELAQKPPFCKTDVSCSALIAKYMGEFRELSKRDIMTGNLNHPIYNNWFNIMPVIEKIEQQYTVKIIRYADELSNVCEIQTTDEDPLQITYSYGYDYNDVTKIDVVFNAIVEFLNWLSFSQADS